MWYFLISKSTFSTILPYKPNVKWVHIKGNSCHKRKLETKSLKSNGKECSTHKLNYNSHDMFQKPEWLESLGPWSSYFLLPILIQSVNSVKKPCYIEDQPNLALFLNRVKPGIALSETMLSGNPLYNLYTFRRYALEELIGGKCYIIIR